MACTGAVPVRRPFLTEQTAGDLLRDLYGMTPQRTKTLPSYSDQNFYIMSGDEVEGTERGTNAKVDEGGWEDKRDHSEYIMKVINSEDSLDAGYYDDIVSVLVFLRGIRDGERDYVIYPTPIRNVHGGYTSLQTFNREADGVQGVFLVFLLSYIPGVILSQVKPLSNQLLFNVGKSVGHLNERLLEYNGMYGSLKARENSSIWCLSCAADTKQFLCQIKDRNCRLLASSVLERFTKDVKPMEKYMQKGLIHADVNRDNIVVAPLLEPSTHDVNQNLSDDVIARRQSKNLHRHAVSGIIDFNDMAYGCLIYDVAGSLVDTLIGRKSGQPLATSSLATRPC